MKISAVFHAGSLVFAVFFALFLLGAERFALESFSGAGLAAALVIFFSLAAGRILARHIFFAIVPVILSLSTVTLLFFVDTKLQKYLFIALSSLLVYVTTLGLVRLSRNPRDAVARGLMVAGATAAMFFFYAAVFGIYLNYVFPAAALAGAIFFVTALMCWQYFVLIANGRFPQTVVYSLAIALVTAQAAAAMTFWPFGYLTVGVVLLMIYYVMWDLAQSYFLDRLSKTRLVINLMLFCLLAASVLLTTRWLPV